MVFILICELRPFAYYLRFAKFELRSSHFRFFKHVKEITETADQSTIIPRRSKVTQVPATIILATTYITVKAIALHLDKSSALKTELFRNLTNSRL